jgi:hypothetical protein
MRALNPIDLPGLLQVLEGPDRTSRRIKRIQALTSLLGSGAGISETLQGGIAASEWLKLGKDALEALSSMRDLTD